MQHTELSSLTLFGDSLPAPYFRGRCERDADSVGRFELPTKSTLRPLMPRPVQQYEREGSLASTVTLCGGSLVSVPPGTPPLLSKYARLSKRTRSKATVAQKRQRTKMGVVDANMGGYNRTQCSDNDAGHVSSRVYPRP